MMIRILLATLVISLTAVYATEHQGGIRLRGADGSIPESIGAERRNNGGSSSTSTTCTYYSVGSDTCTNGQFCFIATGLCMQKIASQTGACQAKSSFCTSVYDPQCGCDGITYSNGCAAASAGVNIASVGECTESTGSTVFIATPPVYEESTGSTVFVATPPVYEE
jgi:hypothetical protein